MELATNVTKPEDNTRYPESIRASGALRALYDNCGEDEELAHLRVKDHGAAFTAILDEFMLYWREIKKELNDSALDYLPNSR